MSEKLLGILLSVEGFVCEECLTVEEKESDNDAHTPIFQSDDWFKGEICVRCAKLVEREEEE